MFMLQSATHYLGGHSIFEGYTRDNVLLSSPGCKNCSVHPLHIGHMYFTYMFIYMYFTYMFIYMYFTYMFIYMYFTYMFIYMYFTPQSPKVLRLRVNKKRWFYSRIHHRTEKRGFSFADAPLHQRT